MRYKTGDWTAWKYVDKGDVKATDDWVQGW
jgi:hypothetical protein